MASILRSNVIKNKVKPKANATSVFGLSNSTSPIRLVTIRVVIVVAGSKGLNVKLAARPEAITTIIVSPTALETPNKIEPTIPGNAAGKITLFFVAGAIYVGAKMSKISELNGHGKSMPLIFLAFFIGSLSIIGVPPMAGSWSKFFLMLGAAESGHLFVLVVFSISSSSP